METHKCQASVSSASTAVDTVVLAAGVESAQSMSSGSPAQHEDMTVNSLPNMPVYADNSNIGEVVQSCSCSMVENVPIQEDRVYD